jgi:hypothetical protein
VTGKTRTAALSAVAAAAVTVLVALAVYGAVWTANAIFPPRDAAIGVGLLALAAIAVLIPVGVWLVLRRLGVRAAGLIAAGTAVVYLLTLFSQATGLASVAHLAVLTVVVGVYTGVAAWLAGTRR